MARIRGLVGVGVGLAAMAWPAVGWAGGFYVPEVGPRAVAMAGAMTTQDTDTTAIFHNPAGLAGQPGTQVQVAGSLFFPNVEFFRRPVDDPITGERVRFAPVRNTNPIGGAPYLGVASDFGVRNFAAGVGVYVPFGAHLEYPADGAQRHIVTNVELRTIYVTPTLAYRFADRFSIGVGASYVYSDIGIEQINAVPFVTGDPELFPNPDPALEGETSLHGRDPASFSANVGLLYADPDGRFALGFSLMVPTKLKFEGEARVTNEAISLPVEEDGREVQPPKERVDDFRLEYPLPLIVRGGIMVRPHWRAALMLDVNWQRWETFDRLVVDFENNYELLPTPGAAMYDVVLDQRWKNTTTIRVAADVMVGHATRMPLHVRAGVLYDQSPIPDRTFDVLAPDSDKVGLSAGLGYTFALGRRVRLDADVGFMHLFLKERNIRPYRVGAPLAGNDDDGTANNDSMDNPQGREIPGSDKTVINKPAPSFFHGVTRAFFDILGVGLTLRV